MSWRKIIFLVVIFLSLTNVANASITQQNRSPRVGKDRNFFREKTIAQVDAKTEAKAKAIILELGLTDEQVTRLAQVDRKFMPQLNQLHSLWKKAQVELGVLITSEDASESKIREKYQEVAALNQKLSELYFERRMAIRAILRPEQRLPYAQYIERKVAESRAENEPE